MEGKWQVRWDIDNEVSQMECDFLDKEDDSTPSQVVGE